MNISNLLFLDMVILHAIFEYIYYRLAGANFVKMTNVIQQSDQNGRTIYAIMAYALLFGVTLYFVIRR